MATTASESQRSVVLGLLEKMGVKNLSKLSIERAMKKLRNRLDSLPTELTEEEQDLITELTGKTAEEGEPVSKKKKNKKNKKGGKHRQTEGGERKLSLLGAARQILKKSKKPMNCVELVEAAAEQGLWTSPGGKTPHATLYSAILRDIASEAPTFKKVDRGHFEYIGN